MATKLEQLISKAQNMTAKMKKLKTDPKVKAYLALEEERKGVHKEIANHVQQYNVKPDKYKPLGLVERTNSWVKVGEVAEKADVYPEFRKVLLGLIHTSKSYYTK